MKKVLISLTLLFALVAPLNATAAIKAGTSCKKAGQTATYGGKKYTCIKSGNKFVWNKGVSVLKPAPAATPTPTPSAPSTPTPTATPTPTPSAPSTPTPSATPTISPAKPNNLNTSPDITPFAELTNVATCKTADLTTRSSGNNGFPRPQGALIGNISPKILFLPLSFADTPAFSDADISHIQSVLTDVKDFYKNTSYGKVNINFEILSKSSWLTVNKTAESYGLTNPRPQQNNADALKEILTKVDTSINFDLYDAVIIETARYPGGGVGQAFIGEKFPTRNGIAKGVSLETANAAGSFQTLAHELGHTLFALEDLYVFLNDQRPSVPGGSIPAGSWDMMSNSTRAFFGWSKFLNGWFDYNQVRCLTLQKTSTHYLETIESQGKEAKLLIINLQEGVSIGVEVRHGRPYSSLGVLVYKIDTRINHGDGPITAQTNLLLEGESLEIDGWRITAITEGIDGMIVKVEKLT